MGGCAQQCNRITPLMFPSPKNLMGSKSGSRDSLLLRGLFLLLSSYGPRGGRWRREQHWRREPARMAAVKERAAGGLPNKPNVIPLETAHYTLSRPATTRRAAAASRVVAQAQPSTKIRMAARFQTLCGEPTGSLRIAAILSNGPRVYSETVKKDDCRQSAGHCSARDVRNTGARRRRLPDCRDVHGKHAVHG